MPHKSDLTYPPRFEVCGGTGWITSKATGSGLTSHNLRHRVGPAALEKHFHDPSRRDHRTHAACAAAELSGRVHSSPMWAGCSHPTLYRTHHRTIPNRDRLSPHIVQCPQGPAILGLSAAKNNERNSLFIRNRAETAACATGQTMPI